MEKQQIEIEKIEYLHESMDYSYDGKNINQAISPDLAHALDLILMDLNGGKVSHSHDHRYSQRMLIHTLLRYGVETHFALKGKKVPFKNWNRSLNLVKSKPNSNRDIKKLNK